MIFPKMAIFDQKSRFFDEFLNKIFLRYQHDLKDRNVQKSKIFLRKLFSRPIEYSMVIKYSTRPHNLPKIAISAQKWLFLTKNHDFWWIFKRCPKCRAMLSRSFAGAVRIQRRHLEHHNTIRTSVKRRKITFSLVFDELRL